MIRAHRWLAVRVILALAIVLGIGRPAAVVLSEIESDGMTVLLPLIMRADLNGERFLIGESVAGRPLEVYRFGTGERHKLIMGGIHGGYEWNTIELVRRLMAHVLADPTMVPADQSLFFLPVLNPDGEARSLWIQGRANDNNADINRNFDHNWQSDWYRVGCWNYLPITAGTHPFSEPEAAALRDFLLDYQMEAVISYHSSGAELYAGGVPPDPASLDLTLALERASGYAYPPHSSPCEMTGQMIDWASSQGIAAVDVELANHQSIDYAPNERILEVFLQWSPPE
jgi:hypothetical protein